jgi:predicted SprT family Zn-dependent metalloprotease
MTPTAELYTALQKLYTHFNNTLFEKQLPDVIFTNQRQVGVMGYFSPNRWASKQGKHCHEIAINPIYVGKASLIELMQTMVHEMTHCWQQCYGKPSRAGYHNKEWANKMIGIGLIPTTTAKPGGNITGQKMFDYPEPNGLFIKSCADFIKTHNFQLPWVDRFAVAYQGTLQYSEIDIEQVLASTLDQHIEDLFEDLEDNLIKEQLCTTLSQQFGEEAFAMLDPNAEKKVKAKYSCQYCGINVWGKCGLRLRCDDCDEGLIES